VNFPVPVLRSHPFRTRSPPPPICPQWIIGTFSFNCASASELYIFISPSSPVSHARSHLPFPIYFLCGTEQSAPIFSAKVPPKLSCLSLIPPSSNFVFPLLGCFLPFPPYAVGLDPGDVELPPSLLPFSSRSAPPSSPQRSLGPFSL